VFDIPGLDMISPFLGPAAGAVGPGMDLGGSIGDAASSAWDFGSDALSNLGGMIDPSMIGGPFMPSLGGPSAGAGAAAASGEIGEPMYFGLPDLSELQGSGGASAEFSKHSAADASADFAPYNDDYRCY
jgi:hypothetical protein